MESVIFCGKIRSENQKEMISSVLGAEQSSGMEIAIGYLLSTVFADLCEKIGRFHDPRPLTSPKL